MVEGAGVRLRRVFGHQEVPLFDPFLMLDDFRSDRPEDYLAGFPWHPHRGIETVTVSAYVTAGRAVSGPWTSGNTSAHSSGRATRSGSVHRHLLCVSLSS
ncbi:MAG: pirin family protein [Methanofollis sp.]|uniref:pirin family protein n=1 Tax=Methanofollis sp. TaxID=2052835 RepID=UPI002629F4C8|nr:pirin family protein [Methanofollis sp.]MDD4255245.1 pirin family protein [Methanofollis sp.]